VAVSVVGSIFSTVVLLNGIPYMQPFGARTPPTHLLVPARLPKVVAVSDCVADSAFNAAMNCVEWSPLSDHSGNDAPPAALPTPSPALICDAPNPGLIITPPSEPSAPRLFGLLRAHDISLATYVTDFGGKSIRIKPNI